MPAATLIVVCALVLSLQLPGAAQSVSAVKTEIKIAILHSSELAQRGSAMAAVQLHTQHTINCLEGPKGMHFKAAAGDPCQGQGNGVIPDLQALAAGGSAGARTALNDATIALDLALQAQRMADVDQAQPWLRVVARYLQKASDDLGM